MLIVLETRLWGLSQPSNSVVWLIDHPDMTTVDEKQQNNNNNKALSAMVARKESSMQIKYF